MFWIFNEQVAEMFNIAGFHIPKQLAFKSGAIILEKLGWGADSIKPLGELLNKKHFNNNVLCLQKGMTKDCTQKH